MRKSTLRGIKTPEQIESIVYHLNYILPERLIIDNLIKGKKVSIHLEWNGNDIEIEVLNLAK